jgi:HlyD family secretion protein
LPVAYRSPPFDSGQSGTAGNAVTVAIHFTAGMAMNIRRFVAAAGTLLAVAALAFAGWSYFLGPVNVQVAAPAQDMPVQVFGLGTVEARVASRVGFKVAGVLVDVAADVGNHAGKGAVLARLDDREQKARVARAAAAVQQAEANLLKADANMEKAKVNFANAARVSERRQQLVATNVTSVEAAESAKAAHETARADVDVASGEVAVAKAAVADARAQLQQENAALDFHTLAAPYDALVIARLKERGAALGASEAVFSLIDPKTIWVLAYIDESKAGDIEVGQPAEIVLRSHPRERLKGKVARIQPESDRINEERRIEVAFDTIPAFAGLGEQAEVYITTVRLPRALLVPERAIIGLARNSGTVWTVEDGQLQQRAATFGHRLLDGRYEVTGGVPAGARVVTQLVRGMRVGRSAQVDIGRSGGT